MTNMNKEVFFKMHLVETAPEAHDEYLNARRGQMITAVAIEDGTFGMYASHRSEDLTKNYTFEVYNNQAAYDEHVAADQYQQFKQEMAGVIVNDQVVDLEPQFMGHQDVVLNISTPNGLWINIVQITVKPEHLADYQRVVTAQLENALKIDPGILAIYAGTKQGRPDDWVIYEVFQSEENYRNHIANPDHQKYVAASKDWVQNKQVDQTIGDVLVNTGNN